MQIAPIQTATVLKRYMQSEKLFNHDVAELTGLSGATIGNFLSGRRAPQKETLERIEGFLKDEGAITRFGFPTDVPPPVQEPVDTEQLGTMGIVTPKLHYVCANLTDAEFVSLVSALSSDRPLLAKLCISDLPNLL